MVAAEGATKALKGATVGESRMKEKVDGSKEATCCDGQYQERGGGSREVMRTTRQQDETTGHTSTANIEMGESSGCRARRTYGRVGWPHWNRMAGKTTSVRGDGVGQVWPKGEGH